jgi:hypothetical protein
MKHKNLLAIVALPLILFSTSLYSQNKQKIKFGQPVMEDLQMTKYTPDTSAAAVILYKKGYFSSEDFTFRVHVRVKILKAAGADFANHTLDVRSKSMIEGKTYNLENGEIVTTKVEKANIFKEDVTKEYFVYKVFFPNVKPGSVVDLQYSHEMLPSKWKFQDVIPVKYNELTLETSQYVFFKKSMFGFAPVKTLSPNRWVAENVPAIVKEPHMPHYSNYVTHFKFDLENITIPGRVYKDYATTWERVATLLMEDEFFGGILKSSGFLNEKAKELRESNLSKVEKINEAYKYIRENIKWNDYASVSASENYRENWKTTHSGNSAEVNLLLISLLKKADINVRPVILSTRPNGLLNQFSASFVSLNYVMAYVDEADTKMLLDACMVNGRPGIIPDYCLNINGLVIDTGGYTQWLDLTKAKPFRKRQFVQISLTDAGEAKAEVTTDFDDYAFLDWMETYEKEGANEEKMNVALTGSNSEMVSQYKVVNVDKLKLKSQDKKVMDLESTEYFQSLGNEFILTPFVTDDFENPFKAEKRLFPIDFNYPINKTVIISILLPANVSIKEIPKSVTFVPENGGAKFSYMASVAGNRISIKADLIIEKQFFTEDQYLSLKNFFSEVSKKIGTPIQIDKKL